MTGLTLLLAYAGWAAAPLIAWAALDHGLTRTPWGFLRLFASYSAMVWAVWAVLRVQGAGQGAAPVAPLAVAGPWAGVAVLSVLLYALGAWTRGRK